MIMIWYCIDDDDVTILIIWKYNIQSVPHANAVQVKKSIIKQRNIHIYLYIHNKCIYILIFALECIYILYIYIHMNVNTIYIYYYIPYITEYYSKKHCTWILGDVRVGWWNRDLIAQYVIPIYTYICPFMHLYMQGNVKNLMHLLKNKTNVIPFTYKYPYICVYV
jgi:hypothetical protein